MKTAQAAGLRLVLLVAIFVSVAVALWGLTLPLLTQHGFRQTQTAISAYWMLHGGGWWDYETPVLGAPWHDPFEFPLFQWSAAILVRATGLALDPAGRLISYIWLVLMIWPAHALAVSYRLPRSTSAFFAILLLSSPVYLFWGHAFLIETQAVTLGFAMLALARLATVRRDPWLAVLATLAGAAGALTKITTLGPFLALLVPVLIEALIVDDGRRGRQVATILVGGMIALTGPVLFYFWTRHADAVKAANPFTAGHMSTNAAIRAWNFGTMEQRTSASFARAIVRSLVDIGGWIGPALALAVPLLLWRLRACDRKTVAILILLAVAWALPFVVFTNLHIVHNYYQAGNAALLLAALAVAFAAAEAVLRPAQLMALLLLVMISQYARFATNFAPSMVAGYDNEQGAIGVAVRHLTSPGGAIVGTGLQWSSAMPYYAERRAMLIADDITEARAQVASLPVSLGGLPLGAVVVCRSPVLADPAVRTGLGRLVRHMESRPILGCRIWYEPTIGVTTR